MLYVIGLLILILVGLRFLPKPNEQPDQLPVEDKEGLRHTIRVNLGILQGEIKELDKLLPSASDMPEFEDMNTRLKAAKTVDQEVTPVLDLVQNDQELVQILGSVFNAMSRTHEVRRFLIDKGLVNIEEKITE